MGLRVQVLSFIVCIGALVNTGAQIVNSILHSSDIPPDEEEFSSRIALLTFLLYNNNMKRRTMHQLQQRWSERILLRNNYHLVPLHCTETSFAQIMGMMKT